MNFETKLYLLKQAASWGEIGSNLSAPFSKAKQNIASHAEKNEIAVDRKYRQPEWKDPSFTTLAKDFAQFPLEIVQGAGEYLGHGVKGLAQGTPQAMKGLGQLAGKTWDAGARGVKDIASGFMGTPSAASTGTKSPTTRPSNVSQLSKAPRTTQPNYSK